MKKIMSVVLTMVLCVSTLGGAALANVGFGTKNIAIKDVHLDCSDKSDAHHCDARVHGSMDIRNSGSQLLVVNCRITVHMRNHGPVAWGQAHLLVKPHRSRTVGWTAVGHDTVPANHLTTDVSDYWVERGTRGNPRAAKVVSCIGPN
jgi:hypothetical protein